VRWSAVNLLSLPANLLLDQSHTPKPSHHILQAYSNEGNREDASDVTSFLFFIPPTFFGGEAAKIRKRG
jgi:hypothetical protein